MSTKTKKKTAWDAPRFTIAEISPHPDYPDECHHQRPRHLATVDGWPRCAECRHELKARLDVAEAPTSATPPDPWLELPLDAHDRAAGAHLED